MVLVCGLNAVLLCLGWLAMQSCGCVWFRWFLVSWMLDDFGVAFGLVRALVLAGLQAL